MAKELEDVSPFDRVEHFFDIKLEEEGGLFPPMKPPGIVAHKEEVVMDAARLDEGALGLRNKVIHVRGEAQRKNLSHNFGDACIRLIGLKSDISSAPSFLGRSTTFAELSQ